jgi:ElaB/YqjD/DUF883 family membrane-anchored ribosome-binding protein
MSDLDDALSREVEQLKTLRDELRVQIHLAKKEAQQAWGTAEKSWEDLESRLRQIKRQSEEPLEKVADATRQLVHEIGDAYRTIRKLV